MNFSTIYNLNAALGKLMNLHAQHLYAMRLVDPVYNSDPVDLVLDDSLSLVASSQFDFEHLVRTLVAICSKSRKVCRELAYENNHAGLPMSELTDENAAIERGLKSARDAFSTFIDDRPRNMKNDDAILMMASASSRLTLELRSARELIADCEDVSLFCTELESYMQQAYRLHVSVIAFGNQLNRDLTEQIILFGSITADQLANIPEGEYEAMAIFLTVAYEQQAFVNDFGAFLILAAKLQENSDG